MIVNVLSDCEVFKVNIEPVYLHYTHKDNLEPIFSDGFLGKAGGFMPVFCINLTLAQKYKNISSLKVPGLLGAGFICLVFNADPFLFKHYPEDAIGIYRDDKPVRIPVSKKDTILLSVEESFEFIGSD